MPKYTGDISVNYELSGLVVQAKDIKEAKILLAKEAQKYIRIDPLTVKEDEANIYVYSVLRAK